MAEVLRYVINASVVTKWFLRDEEFAPEALSVYRDFRDGRIDLLAPRHMELEVANAVIKAERRGRISNSDLMGAMSDIPDLGITLLDNPSLERANYYTQWLGCSLYDSLFVATSLRAQLPMLSADFRLRNASRDKFIFYLWIEDYQKAEPRL